ncbi:quinon protein alcohol dehydrogenase-like superfamily [Trichoderma velutinum]
MDISHNISGNTFGSNSTLVQGNITFNATPSDDDNKFLQEISKTDPVYDKKRIQSLKGTFLYESFLWILDHKHFKRWRTTEDSGIFWIKGDPGKGKTMLLCGIIDEFEKEPKLHSRIYYFFCQATDTRINSANAVIGGLTSSLLKRHRWLLPEVRDKYKSRINGPNTWITLCEIFETIIHHPDCKNLVFIIDALDECVEDCGALLRLIIKTKTCVKWLVSSRNEKEIERELRSIQPPQILSLEQNSQYTAKSIDIYISSCIQEITALDDDEELRNRTLNALKTKAMGTYLWVALVVEQLRSTDRWEVDDVLEEIPPGLESLYSLIINQADHRLSTNKKRQDACQILLSIITTAERPLHLKELYTFMSFQWDNFNSTYKLDDIQSIAKNYGSIFSIRDGIVYFIHQSAKDYIIKTKFNVSSGLRGQHLRMFQTSINAMSRNLTYDIYNLKRPGIHISEIQSQKHDSLDPMRYCCVFWGQHLLCSSSGAEGEKTREANAILSTFFKTTFLCWVESLSLMGYMPQGLAILEMVKNLVDDQCGKVTSPKRETQELRQLIHDAYRFLLRFKGTVEEWPLQLYFAAISFDRVNSTIRQAYEPSVRAYWGPSPTVASVSQNPSSLLLQTIILNATERIWETLFSGLSFSPDSSLIYSLYKDTLRVNRTDTGDPEAEIIVGDDSKIAILPDSNGIIIVSRGGNVKIWNLECKSVVQEYSLSLSKKDTTEEAIIALSSNGDLIASFHTKLFPHDSKLYDKMSSVRLWKTKNLAVCDYPWGQRERPLVAFSPDSQLVAIADRNNIRIYCPNTGNLLVENIEFRRCDNPNHNHNSRPKPHFLFSPDSKYLIAIEYNENLCIWNTKTWELLHRIRGPRWIWVVEHIAISPDSAFVGLCNHEGTRLWSIETGECITKIAGNSLLMEFFPNWTKSALVAVHTYSAAIQIRRIDVNINTPHAENSFVNIVISPDSRFVAAKKAQNDSICIWSGDSGQQIRVLSGNFREEYRCLPAFSPDSKLLAYYGGGGGIFVWSVSTGETICLLRPPHDKHWISDRIVAFSPDSNYLVASGTKICIWRIDTCQCVYEHIFPGIELLGLSSIAVSSHSTYAASLFWVLQQWRVRIMLCRGGRCVTNSVSDRWNRDAGKIAFSSDSTVLVHISRDMVRLLEVTTGACLQHFDLQFESPPRWHLAVFHPIKDLIFTATSVICKKEWNRWEEFPREGYSYIHDYSAVGPAWIARSWQKIFYLPTDLKSGVLIGNSDISDSLFAFLNVFHDVVIIRFPTEIARANNQALHP